jgi:FHA domain/Protein of unknown function (DUF3662)
MRTLVFLLVVVAVGVVVWRRRQERSRVVPSGTLASLVDYGRDALAPLYPSRPLSRRALPRRLLRAAEQTVTVGVSGMVLVPTRIEITVNPADLEPFTGAMEWLRRDLGEALRIRAAENGWMVPDGPDVVIIPSEERPLRLPRAVGRIGAWSPSDVRTRLQPARPPDAMHGPAPGPAPNREPTPVPPEPTAMTSVVLDGDDREGGAEGADGADGADGAGTGTEAFDQPTEALPSSVHVRLVSLAERTGDGVGDLNALLVSTEAPLVLGRSREADLQVRDRQVSGRHCSLSVDAEGREITVEDLGSMNGTFVDGNRVEQASRLDDGATLRIGTSSWRIALDPVTGP